MKRILCLWLPNWTVQRILRDRPELRGRPIVLHALSRGKPTVIARSRAAAQYGVVPGMPLAEARALWPLDRLQTGRHVHGEPYDAEADRRTLVKWAFFAQRYSPLVALEEAEAPECLLLDITGCAPLFGGERALANKVVHDLRRHGLVARVAIADTIGAAWAMAHAGTAEPTIAPARKHHDALASLDIALLRIPAETVRLLRQFDLHSVRLLLDLPRTELSARFGRELLLRLDQALGDVPEVLRPERFVEPVAASWTFDEPLAQRRVLEQVLAQLLDNLLARLVPRQLGIERLTCELALTNKELVPLSIGLLEPGDCRPYLLELLRLRLENVRLAAEIARVSLRAVVGPRVWRQGRLFPGTPTNGGRQPPDETFGTGQGLHVLVERLSSRVGARAVLRPYLRPEAQPEYSWGYAAWIGSPQRQQGNPPALSRPLGLRKTPERVRVDASGPPAQFVWRGKGYAVAHVWGPERIETGWWHGRDVRRDYYRVEASDGERFWLFRDLERNAWFLHGVYH